MKTIITTTGISLLNNARRLLHTDSPTDEQVKELLRNQPEVASAEVNSLRQIAQHDDHLIFLRTETPIAERCMNLLREFFIEYGYKPYQVEVKELQFQDDEYHMETLGLRNLVNTIIYEVEKAQRENQEIIINATAGFKAQIV